MRTQIQTEAKTQTKSGVTSAPTSLLQRKCACGNHTMGSGECTECGKQKRLGMQAKLKISEPGDSYEQEADRVAKQVMRMPERRTGVLIQRRIDGASIARMLALQRTEAGADKFAIESDKPKEEGGRCPSWRGDPQSISKRAGEFYARNHLTPLSQATVEQIECEPPVSSGNYGCYVHFSDGLVLRVIVRETDIVVGTGPGPFTTLHPPPATPLCFYAYSCPEGDLVLTVLRCQSAKPSGSSSSPAVARRAASGAPAPVITPSIVGDAVNSPGRPLDPAVRTFFEPRFGHDFSQVRVHTDARAAESARAVNALAYTVERDVVFGASQYEPGTAAGRRLLAHELAHTVQQSTRQSIARKPDSKASNPKVPSKSKTVFHPGVMHGHQPSGRWADVQKSPKSRGIIGEICANFAPENVMRAASVRALYDKPIAAAHLRWYFSGGGKDFIEDSNLELMLRTDAEVQAKVAKQIPTGQSSGTFADHVTITQDNYSDEDFQFAFGEIDRLDFEIDFDAGTFHAWFQDRYEWHPVYPFYKSMPGDYLRDTNCVHAAAVELKANGARDYWMKGETTIPLKAIRSTASRKDPWREPLVIKGF